jgi:hypothetical protein
MCVETLDTCEATPANGLAIHILVERHAALTQDVEARLVAGARSGHARSLVKRASDIEQVSQRVPMASARRRRHGRLVPAATVTARILETCHMAARRRPSVDP